ncbi:domesticated amidase effector 2-like [Amblyomma americanum]
MKTLAVLPALLLLFDMVSGGFVCDNPMPYVGTYKDQHRDRTQCTALVKLICPGLRNDTTHEWVSGEPVLPSCNIPQWTAIATFLGPGGNYNAPPRWNQHAAVFDSCEDGGIWVRSPYFLRHDPLASAWVQAALGKVSDKLKRRLRRASFHRYPLGSAG